LKEKLKIAGPNNSVAGPSGARIMTVQTKNVFEHLHAVQEAQNKGYDLLLAVRDQQEERKKHERRQMRRL